jgi:hypothetical protein
MYILLQQCWQKVVTWFRVEVFVDLTLSLRDERYMMDKLPNTTPCPFAGGDLYRTHSDVVARLSTLPTRLAEGTVVRGNVIGRTVIASGLYVTEIGKPDLPTRRLAQQDIIQTMRDQMQKPEVWHEIERGFLEPPADLFVWWNSVMWGLLGMGELNATDSRSLCGLRNRTLLCGSYLPDWRVFRRFVSDQDSWLERIRHYYPLHAESVLDMLLFAGGRSIPQTLQAGLAELRKPGGSHPPKDMIDAFVYETLRIRAPVGTIAYFVGQTDRRQMLSLRAAALDPSMWGPDPRLFALRPLEIYHRNFMGFGEPATVCPAKAMAMEVLRRLFLAYIRRYEETPQTTRWSFQCWLRQRLLGMNNTQHHERGDTITADTIVRIVQAEERPLSILDLSVQWLLSPPQHLMDHVPVQDQPLHGLRWNDGGLSLLALPILQSYYSHTEIWTPDMSVHERHARFDAMFRPAAPEMPCLTTNMELLEFSLNNLWLGDILYRISPTQYEIRTDCLNTYEHDDPTKPTGSTIGVNCVSDQFRVSHLTYVGVHYTRETIPEYVSARVILGILAYMTIQSHLMKTHVRMGFQRVRHNRKCLPITHPIRLLLLPTEPGTIRTTAMAQITLMVPGAVVDMGFPYTFAGLRAMIAADTTHTIEGPVPQTVLSDIWTWRTYIMIHMGNIVRTIYPDEDALARDMVLHAWLGAKTRVTLETHLVDVFMSSVHHSFLSSSFVDHIGRMSMILDPETVNATKRLSMIVTFASTNTLYIPLNRDFSTLHEYPETVARFYEGMQTLHVHHPRAAPGVIEHSCGST